MCQVSCATCHVSHVTCHLFQSSFSSKSSTHHKSLNFFFGDELSLQTVTFLIKRSCHMSSGISHLSYVTSHQQDLEKNLLHELRGGQFLKRFSAKFVRFSAKFGSLNMQINNIIFIACK